jgi:hypothetical protein
MPYFEADPLQGQHDHVLVVVTEVRAFVNGRDLELTGSDLVVTGLDRIPSL